MFSNGNGNGYDGYSMSNNARSAYDDGERPLSKWTKAAIMSEIKNHDVSTEVMAALQKVNAKRLSIKGIYDCELNINECK